MEVLHIVELIEKNPITKLTKEYNDKLLNKIKNSFTQEQQQIFVTSFYCYLHYDSKKDFVIDLDDIWGWLGFSQKVNAKKVLERYFKENIDYRILLCNSQNQKNVQGGHNKQIIMLTVKTFKMLCLKSDTKKSNEIHEYYIKLEEILQEVIEEEGNELKQQLQQKSMEVEKKSIELQNHKIISEKEKQQLLEKTLIEQFPVNTQCIYYGTIDNKSGGKVNSKMYQESLIKFGQSNNLGERIKSYKKNFINFRLIAAFKVKNKIEIENAIKRDPILKKRIRSLTTIPDANFNEETYRELLALDNEDFTLEKMDNYFKEIIKENEYNIENYNLLLNKNDELENKIRDLEDEIKKKDIETEKIKNELEQYKPDISTHIQKRIASNYAECKIGYYLYAFECEYMKYKCSISRQSDFEILETNLKNIDKDGKMVYFTSVSYPMSEKIMMFLLKKSVVLIGNNKFEGCIHEIKKTMDTTVKLEKLLIDCHNDLDKLNSILDQEYTINNNEDDPETPIVRKAKRAIDQIDMKTGEVIKTHESIEAAGRSLGIKSGSGIGIALRENRQCKGFLWRYTGISKEEQFEEQPVIKICCKTGEKMYFKNIAESARDVNISAPALRRRILTNVHVNNYHWIFNKNATHYQNNKNY